MEIEILMSSIDSFIKTVSIVSLKPSPIQLRLLYSKYRFAFLKIMLQFPVLQLSNVLSKVTSCSKQEVHTILFDYYLNLSVYICLNGVGYLDYFKKVICSRLTFRTQCSLCAYVALSVTFLSKIRILRILSFFLAPV